ncbi:MAG TPA: class I SAM-dependent methyltransferase [Povalibacter sp.]
MAQITSGLRVVLSNPLVYTALQDVLGATNARARVCSDYIRAKPGDNVVDVGCGPAEALRFLPSGINYYGFDLSPDYIESARRSYGDRGSFHCADVTQLAPGEIPPCDVAVAFGVLHHLDDDGAKRLIEGLHARLAPGGRLITLDPAFVPGQSLVARKLAQWDRGQNVRTPQGYLDLVSARYATKQIHTHHDYLRVPYTLVVMESIKSPQ